MDTKWAFLTFVAAVFIGGCTQVASIRPGWLQKAEEEQKLPPPTPAPPLAIEEPAPQQNPTPQAKKAHYETPDVAPALVPVTPPRIRQASVSTNRAAKATALHRGAAERLRSLPAYRARLRRRELIHGKQLREETLMEQYRRSPKALAWQWLDGVHTGHRLVYAKSEFNQSVQWIAPEAELPIFKTKRVTSYTLKDPKIQQISRLPISRVGLESWISRFGQHVQQFAAGETNAGEFHYLGSLKRPEFVNKVEAVMHVLPPDCDPFLPSGGQRLWFFDPAHRLPVLIITHNDQGREIGYFCYDRLETEGRLPNAVFNLPPEK